MTSYVISNSVETNKYGFPSLTIKFQGVPTVKQIIHVAKLLAPGCTMKPDFKSSSLEVLVVPEDGLTKVQFHPNVRSVISTTNLK